MKYPIYIPSKGRAKSAKFIQFLHTAGIEFTIFIESHEYHTYSFNFPNATLKVLPLSNQGITYVRNHIKKTSEDLKDEKYWIFDDDITGLYYREGSKMVKCGAEVLEAAEYCLRGFALGSLDYQQFAWSATKNIVQNSFCDVAVLVDNNLTYGLRYRPMVEGKEDRDFAMQVIKSGQRTARTTLQAFAAPKNGSNSGGLKEIFYDLDGREEKCSTAMVELWGTEICVPITKKDGRKDVKIHWEKIYKNELQNNLF